MSPSTARSSRRLASLGLGLAATTMLGAAAASTSLASHRAAPLESAAAAAAPASRSPSHPVRELAATISAGDEVDLAAIGVPLDGRRAIVQRIPHASPDRTVVSGTIAGDPARGLAPGQFIVARRAQAIVGLVRLGPGGAWRITSARDGSASLDVAFRPAGTEPDCTILDSPRSARADADCPGCDHPAHSHAHSHSHSHSHSQAGSHSHATPAEADASGLALDGAGTGDGDIVDILVVYPSQFNAEFGGPDGAAAEIDLVIEETNLAFTDSIADGGVRLVGLHAYSGSPISLGDLAGVDDGVYDEVHTLRDAYAADIVVGIDQFSGGVAFGLGSLDSDADEDAFALVGIGALTNIVFPHEVGHVLGACHAIGDGGGCGVGLLFDYSNGHRWTGDSGQLWATLMAYTPGERLPRFSNPNVLFDGVPTGLVPGDGEPGADNVSTFEVSVPFVADYRLADGGPCSGLPIDPGAADCNGNDIPDPCEIRLGLVGDVNGNDIPDVCDPCSADLDGSGGVDLGDILTVLSAWGSCDGAVPCVGDFDGDGMIGVTDLLSLLSAWGDCG